MAGDDATLSLGVDASRANAGLREYESNLKRADDATTKAEKNHRRLSAALDRAASARRQSVRTTKILNQAQRERLETERQVIDLLHQEALAMDQLNSKTVKGTRRSTAGIGRLNNALFTMTRRATGASTVATQLLDVLGTFALGVGTMTAIIGGVTALALAYNQLSKEARETKKEAKEAREELEKLIEAGRISELGEAGGIAENIGRLQAVVDAARAVQREILGATSGISEATGGGRGAFGPNRGQARAIAEQQEIIDGANKLIAKLEEEARADARREALEFKNFLLDIEKKHTADVLAETERRNKALEAVTSAAAKAAEAGVSADFSLISVDDEIAAIGEIEAVRAATVVATLAAIFAEEEKARRERIAREKATSDQIAADKLKAEAETMRKIRMLAQGLDILGGAIGGVAGGTLQGIGGGAATGASMGGLPGAIVGGILGGFGGFFSSSKRQAEEDARKAEEAARIRQRQLDELARNAREQANLLEAQLSEQQRVVDVFRGVVTTLGDFGDSLKLSNLSPLSPSQKLAEARSQFEAIRALALGGDVSAAESLPEASRSLLQASRAFNASGLGFVSDFERVQTTVDLVQGQFQAQLTIEEQILEAIQRQTDEANARAAEAFAQAERLRRGTGGGDSEFDDPEGDPGGDPVLSVVNEWRLEVATTLNAILEATESQTTTVVDSLAEAEV